MKDYEFQYTKIGKVFFVLLICIGIGMVIAYVGRYLQSPTLVTIFDLVILFLSFQKLKKIAIHDCTARLTDSFIEFQFDKKSSVINLNNLKSFRYFQSRGGAALYLKSKGNNFRIIVNPFFCNPKDFNLFCDDLLVKLKKYKEEINPSLINDNLFYTRKSFVYFLIFGTLAYIISFFFESQSLRIGVGISVGFYLLFMWNMYFIEKYAKPNKM